MQRAIRSLLQKDLLSAGVIVGIVALVADGLLEHVFPDVRLRGVRPSFFIALTAVPMLAVGRYEVLTQKRALKEWVTFVRVMRWVLLPFWIFRLLVSLSLAVYSYIAWGRFFDPWYFRP